jgi:hypothetical protein
MPNFFMAPPPVDGIRCYVTENNGLHGDVQNSYPGAGDNMAAIRWAGIYSQECIYNRSTDASLGILKDRNIG